MIKKNKNEIEFLRWNSVSESAQLILKYFKTDIDVKNNLWTW